MPLVQVLKGNFVSGEVSPLLRAMTDLTRYRNGARKLVNWQVLPLGGVRRRYGTRYIATAGTASQAVILRPFEPSTSNAYVVEFGHQYIRFYQNSAYTGISIASGVPYVASTLRLLRSAQANDVMLLVHPDYAPRRLTRTSPSSFELSLVPFYPPPTYEAGQVPNTTLTLSATAGSITLTAGAAAFMPSDIQRVVSAGVGRAIITAYTSSTVVSALVVDAFSGTSVSALGWTIGGSPIAQLTPDKSGPVGATVTLTLGGDQPTATDLVAHGAFDAGLTGWTDYSGATQLATGTHDSPANSVTTLLDNSQNFVTAGVLTTHVVVNDTDGSNGVITAVAPRELTFSGGLKGGTDGDFDIGDTYKILETGASRVQAGVAQLSGGTAGHGWIEQGITTTAGVTYQVRFTVQSQPMAFGVGNSVTAFDVLSELSYPPGEQTVTFTALGSTSYLQFRNNQNSWAGVTQVSARAFTVDGWRSTDINRYVRVHGGLVKLRGITDAHTAVGEIIRELSSDEPAGGGAWSLEDPAWSDTLGWPSAVALYEGRLFVGGNAAFPQTVWGSAIDSFFDFFAGVNPEEAVELHLVDSGGNITLNQIRWIMPAENMIVGTTHGEYRLIGSGDDPISAATPPRNRPQSAFGSDTVQPIKIDQSLLFAQRQGSKLRQIALDQAATTRFQTQDLSLLSEHLLRTTKLVELTYAAEPIATIWGVRTDGVLLGITFDLAEQIAGWWQFVTNGHVESLAVIPHPTANAHQVWLVVQRTINSVSTRYIEVMDPDTIMSYVANGVSQQWTGLQVDAAVSYAGAPTTTIGSLNHLNNMPVSIVGDGIAFPDQVVTSNQVVLSQAVSFAQVGLSYASLGETLPPEVGGGSSIQASQKHWYEIGLLLDSTPSIRLQGIDIVQPNYGLYTGEVHQASVGWDREGILTFEQHAPLPATVLGITGKLDVEMESDAA